jgi:hypothetical protein
MKLGFIANYWSGAAVDAAEPVQYNTGRRIDAE